MPTPLELLLDPISRIIIALYLGLLVWETISPAARLPEVRFWRAKGLVFFLFFFFLSSYLPLLIDRHLEPYRLVDLSGWGTLGGAVVGILLYELGIYIWHRAMHRSDFLWRTFHQMHHSAERIDAVGAFFFSPLDMIGFTLLGSLCFALLVGLAPEAITVVLLMTTFFSMFQHANIRTPRWLGYIVQRPESHTVHHGRGIHRYNYSDLPLFDIIFGTFRNPQERLPETGFYPGASERITEMLTARKVDTPQSPVTSNQ